MKSSIVSIRGITQAEFDAKFNAKDSDDLTEGAANKYDTGAPPATTDDLVEGTTSKYDTGVPPATTDDLPEGTTSKYVTATEKNKLIFADITQSATAPETPAEEDVYYNTTDEKFYIYRSAAWVQAELGLRVIT